MTDRQMYERSYGHLYDQSLSTPEIAKRVRSQVKVMQKAGVLPAGWKVSVRSERFAGGSAINIAAKSPRPIYAANPYAYGTFTLNVETGEHVHGHHDRYTREAQAMHAALTELLAAYNHNGSEVQVDYFDVNFYSDVTLGVLPDVAQSMPGVVEDHSEGL